MCMFIFRYVYFFKYKESLVVLTIRGHKNLFLNAQFDLALHESVLNIVLLFPGSSSPPSSPILRPRANVEINSI
jgi:hypothetical protein